MVVQSLDIFIGIESLLLRNLEFLAIGAGEGIYKGWIAYLFQICIIKLFMNGHKLGFKMVNLLI